MSARKRVAIPIRVEPGADLPAAERAAVLDAVKQNRALEGALLPILHAHPGAPRAGYRRARVPLIAYELNLSRAEVHGVMTFYHYFRQQPAGPAGDLPVPRRGLPGGGRGGARGARQAGARASSFTAPAPMAAITLEPVYCLGNCACGPSLLIDRELHGRVTPERFDALIAARQRAVRRWRHERHGLRSARGHRAVAGRAKRWRARMAAEAARRRRGGADRAQRFARAVLARAAGRSADRDGPHRLRPGAGRRRAGAVRRGLSERRAARAAPGTGRVDSLSEEPGAADLRAPRRHRSAAASTTTARTAATRASTTRWRWQPADDRAGGDRFGPARPRRRGVSDRHQVEDGARCAGARRNTSSAMPTKATRAPSPIAC